MEYKIWDKKNQRYLSEDDSYEYGLNADGNLYEYGYGAGGSGEGGYVDVWMEREWATGFEVHFIRQKNVISEKSTLKRHEVLERLYDIVEMSDKEVTMNAEWIRNTCLSAYSHIKQKEPKKK